MVQEVITDDFILLILIANALNQVTRGMTEERE